MGGLANRGQGDRVGVMTDGGAREREWGGRGGGGDIEGGGIVVSGGKYAATLMSTATPYILVQWSEDVIKADPFFGRSWVRIRMPPWVSNKFARGHLALHRRRPCELRTVV